MDRIPAGVDPMLRDLEAHIVQSGLDDMKANADIITTVSLQCVGVMGEGVGEEEREGGREGEHTYCLNVFLFFSSSLPPSLFLPLFPSLFLLLSASLLLTHLHTHTHTHTHTHSHSLTLPRIQRNT